MHKGYTVCAYVFLWGYYFYKFKSIQYVSFKNLAIFILEPPKYHQAQNSTLRYTFVNQLTSKREI